MSVSCAAARARGLVGRSSEDVVTPGFDGPIEPERIALGAVQPKPPRGTGRLPGDRGEQQPAPAAGTLQAGSVGGVPRSVSRTYAPPRAGRQCAPVASSIVIGASCGTSGTSGSTTFWRRVGAIGTSTPARAAVRPRKGPVARTTR